MDISKKVRRLIKKSFGGDSFVTDLFSESEKDKNTEFKSHEFADFLSKVDKAFEDLDTKVNMLFHNLNTSTDELTESNIQLQHLHHSIKTMMNSLEEGFFAFDLNGIGLATFSANCPEMLGLEPSGRKIEEVLNIPIADLENFKNWFHLLASEHIAFDEICHLGPETIPNSQGRTINVSYKPMRDESGELNGLVVIAQDNTQKVLAEKKADEAENIAEMILKIAADQYSFVSFMTFSTNLIADLKNSNFDFKKMIYVEQVSRLLHTLKGSASLFGMVRLVSIAHHSEEEFLNAIQYKSRSEIKTVMYEISLELESYMATFSEKFGLLFGEIGKKKNTLSREIEEERIKNFYERMVDEGVNPKLKECFFREFLFVPVKGYLKTVPSVLDARAMSQNKKVSVEINGDESRIPPERFENFFSTFQHLLNNCVDHGIEEFGDRQAIGKPEAGKILIDYFSEDDILHIDISDNGAGINVDSLRNKIEGASNFTDEEIMMKIFDNGISGSNEVSAFSGRGIGMNAVLFEVNCLGGTIEVSSKRGEGTQFFIRLPISERLSPTFSMKTKAA